MRTRDEAHALFQVARDNFVAARLSLAADAIFGAQLLMEQCFETTIKALIKASAPDRTFGARNGHRLCDLLREARKTNPDLEGITGDPTAMKLVQTLQDGYSPIRYGEAIVGSQPTLLVKTFDRAAWYLISVAGRALTYEHPFEVSVAEPAVSLFLWKCDLPIEEQKAIKSTLDPAFDRMEFVIRPPWSVANNALQAAITSVASLPRVLAAERDDVGPT